MKYEEAQRLVDVASTRLAERFEAVQVLATLTEDGVTRMVVGGAGNWYARRAMAAEFVELDNARRLAQEIADQLDQVAGPGSQDD